MLRIGTYGSSLGTKGKIDNGQPYYLDTDWSLFLVTIRMYAAIIQPIATLHCLHVVYHALSSVLQKLSTVFRCADSKNEGVAGQSA